MKKLKIECNINVFESLDELPRNIQKLMHNAQEARLKAHAPYSNFLVGAAILDEKGSIHQGQNVENAAYPNGICAETSAIAMMIQQGGTRIVKMAVSGKNGKLLLAIKGLFQNTN